MKKILGVMLAVMILAAGAARAETPVFTSAEYDCLQALGKEIYEDYSKPVIDALPAYLKDSLRAALDKQSCNDAGVAQIISLRLDNDDAAYLAPFGFTLQRVQILPQHLNIHLHYVIHDPDIPDSSKKTLIRGMAQREMPAALAKLTDADLVFLDLNMSEGEVLQRMPPNLIQQLHDIINDPKLELHDAEKHEKTRLLMADERLTSNDITYLNTAGHHEEYLSNPNEVLKGVHFAIADTTISAAEKKRRVDALMTPENNRRSAWESKLLTEQLGMWLMLLFPLIVVGAVPLAAWLLAGPGNWEQWKPRLPWIALGLVGAWALAMLGVFGSDLVPAFRHLFR